MKSKTSGNPNTKSKSQGIGVLYTIIILFLTLAAATWLSGGLIPVDPNGPEGPPTLPPYFGIDGDQDEQRIIYPPGALTPDPKGNLQLKTFKVNVCGQKSAIDILIDTSGSMTDENKIGKIKDSLKIFTKNFSNTTAVAIQTFSDQERDKVPWDLYKNNKQEVQTTINNLPAQGHTVMRNGFKLAKDKLNEAISQNKFPGYNYTLLLISDGVPEIPPPSGASPYDPARCNEPNYDPAPAGDNRNCYARVCDPITAPALRCFVKDQDPRIPTSLPQEIKNMGVSIYAIGLYADSSSDNKLRDWLEPLLKEVVSQPVSTYYYAYDSKTSTEKLKTIFENIVTKICEDEIK
ncbi:VWA domain-containing protein [Patescibacteria group bacterium]|nr:VWA domain-containing protein [Patescibacteria group bacterium]MBU4016422.1 VWA domain-containing protein [Patescibacteria group bacterium]MBU4098148.1 VWA domain-containing protein [Patescibacteria group bacterium]